MEGFTTRHCVGRERFCVLTLGLPDASAPHGVSGRALAVAELGDAFAKTRAFTSVRAGTSRVCYLSRLPFFEELPAAPPPNLLAISSCQFTWARRGAGVERCALSPTPPPPALGPAEPGRAGEAALPVAAARTLSCRWEDFARCRFAPDSEEVAWLTLACGRGSAPFVFPMLPPSTDTEGSAATLCCCLLTLAPAVGLASPSASGLSEEGRPASPAAINRAAAGTSRRELGCLKRALCNLTVSSIRACSMRTLPSSSAMVAIGDGAGGAGNERPPRRACTTAKGRRESVQREVVPRPQTAHVSRAQTNVNNWSHQPLAGQRPVLLSCSSSLPRKGTHDSHNSQNIRLATVAAKVV